MSFEHGHIAERPSNEDTHLTVRLFSRCREHDQQVDVAVRVGVAAGMRTEQDHLERIEPFHDPRVIS